MRREPDPSPDLSVPEDSVNISLANGQAGTWQLRTGERGNHLNLSPELQNVLGFKPGEYDETLRTFLDRVHPQDRAGLLKRISKVIGEGGELELEFRIAVGATPRWFLARGRCYRQKSNGDPVLLGLCIDITRQKIIQEQTCRRNSELERRQAETAARLDAVEKEFEAFCYSVSHDLRAPLRSVRGFNEVLAERYADNLDARGKEFLKRACESSRHMDELIEGLLKLSRAGRAEMSRQMVNLSHIAGNVATDLGTADPSRQVTFDIAPGLQALGDERLLRMVMDNLFRNAWKFTSKKPHARIQFGFAREPKPVFFVRDNGAGFDQTYATRLFGVFQRLHSSEEFPGIGVGLAIVQRIITRHGGQVWATGSLEKGATFFFTLPTDEAL